MRTITNALLTAQTAASGRPHVRVEALDMLAGVARLNSARHYTGAEEAFHHAATSPADGSLVRVRMTSSDGALWVQRTANPGPASDFSPVGAPRHRRDGLQRRRLQPRRQRPRLLPRPLEPPRCPRPRKRRLWPHVGRPPRRRHPRQRRRRLARHEL